ncbi:hypothetical protein H106_08970 [Trichophyton rubrum CBS 735.88]|nr:hypothetical protein H106_08970 [Trichophyton rubrum CBS 735.88]
MAEQSWRGGFSRLEQPAGPAGEKAIELPHREQQQDEQRAEVPGTALEESSLSERARGTDGDGELVGRADEDLQTNEGRKDLGRRGFGGGGGGGGGRSKLDNTDGWMKTQRG